MQSKLKMLAAHSAFTVTISFCIFLQLLTEKGLCLCKYCTLILGVDRNKLLQSIQNVIMLKMVFCLQNYLALPRRDVRYLCVFDLNIRAYAHVRFQCFWHMKKTFGLVVSPSSISFFSIINDRGGTGGDCRDRVSLSKTLPLRNKRSVALRRTGGGKMNGFNYPLHKKLK